MAKGLQSGGYEVLTAHSRDEAEQAAEDTESIDVLVTDIFLGDGWGGELAFKLRGEHPSLAVVFISGRAGEDPILRHGIQEDMVFLEKPFTLVELAEAVNEATGKSPS
jgi:CheY-like chemotaxis protein